jgi:hypothetical protein
MAAELKDNGDGTITVHAPSGPLGFKLFEGPEGPVIGGISAESPLSDSVKQGMRLLSVDGVNLSYHNPSEAAEELKKRSEQSSRILVLDTTPPPTSDGRILCYVLMVVILILFAIGSGVYLYMSNQSRAQLAKDKAYSIATKLARNKELGLSNDFIKKVVLPAMQNAK